MIKSSLWLNGHKSQSHEKFIVLSRIENEKIKKNICIEKLVFFGHSKRYIKLTGAEFHMITALVSYHTC